MGNNESKSPDTNSKSAENNLKGDDKSAQAGSKIRSFVEPAGDVKKNQDKKKKPSDSEKPVDEGTKLAFEEWLYLRLTKYFDDIQEKLLKLKISKEERHDIGAAVEEFLDFLFTETEVVDRRFRINIKDIIKVGTFYENTDVSHVDELCFCIVISELSRENIQTIVREIKDNDELLKVYLKDGVALRWEDCVEDESADKHWLRSDRGLATTFFDRVAKAVENVKSKARSTIYRKHGRLDLFEVNGVTKRGASVELKFTWNGEAILTVVLTPCLRYDNILEFIDEDCTLGKLAHKQLRSEGKLLLQPVADTDEFFQWHFGHVEKEYLKTYVSPAHKHLYQMIKFLVQGYNRNTVAEAEYFSELSIKMLVLIHHHNCKMEDRLADCVMGVIEDMRNLLKAFRDRNTPIFLQSCFYKYQNVLPMPCRQYREDAIDLNLAGLEQLANHLINEIGCTALYDFNNAIKTLVPLNEFILKKDYLAKKYGTDGTSKESIESSKALIDAVSNRKFTVQF